MCDSVLSVCDYVFELLKTSLKTRKNVKTWKFNYRNVFYLSN